MSTMSTAVRGHVARPVQLRPAGDLNPPALSPEAVRERYLEASRLGLRLNNERYIQGSLAVDFRSIDEDATFGPQVTTRESLPDAHEWSTRMIGMILECISGARPPRQLLRWMTPDCHQLIARRHVVSLRRGGGPLHPASVRRVRVCEPINGAAEISAVVWLEGRARAIALRLNGADGRWLVTQLVIG